MRLQGKEGIVEVGITLRLGSVWVERGWGGGGCRNGIVSITDLMGSG